MLNKTDRNELLIELLMLEASVPEIKRYRAIQAVLMNDIGLHIARTTNEASTKVLQDKNLSDSQRRMIAEVSATLKGMAKTYSELFGIIGVFQSGDNETSEILTRLMKKYNISVPE